MGKIYEYIRGYYTVTASARGAAQALDLLIKNAVPFYKVRSAPDGCVSFRLDPASLKKYLSLTDGHIIENEKVERTGLLSVALKYKMRAGFFAGAIIFAAIIAASSLFVWDINIEGEENISEDEILTVLKDYGVYIGAYIPNIDTQAVSLQTVIAIEPLSYASVNLRGTVAQVIVREEKKELPEDLSLPSNLLASRDGQIETIEILGGIPSVKRGQIVKKGQLLVSGVIDSQAVGYRLVRARGNVYAKTTLQYKSEIPLDYDKKISTGNVIYKKTLIFFAKKINLFSNDEISFENYDTIEKEKRLCLFGVIELPVFLRTVIYSEYETVAAHRSESDAVKLAYLDIREQSEKELDDAQILARYSEVSVADGVLTMNCDIECVTDIAEEVIIETD